jgi:hypothetical protein
MEEAALMHFRTYLFLGLAVVAAGLIAYPFTLATAQPPDSGTRCKLGRKVNDPWSVSQTHAPAVPTMLVNSRRIKLNYAIKDVGPSGVERVELWATRDGKSWARYSNEPPPGGPLVVQVAEEGKYGFTVVVRNGVGVRSPEPKEGDAPQVWVVVDETCPTVKLTRAKVLMDRKVPTLDIRWKASDERMMPRPVTISTALKPEGPWTPVATALENNGRFEYKMKKDHPYEFFVRVEAMDQAGNVGHDCTKTPVHVDMVPPSGVIIGVDAEKHARLPVVVPGALKAEEKRVEHKKPLMYHLSGSSNGR